MEDKIVKLINNFKNYVNSGGDWTLISGVDSEMGLIVSRTPVNKFNLYKYIEDNFGIRLNVLTIDKFMEDYREKVQEDYDDAPTGYLSIDVQYALINRQSGKSIVFDTIEKSLGRSSSKVDVHITGDGVSRVHCFIKLISGEPCIRDNSSTNGVFVDGSKISDVYVKLRPNSKVQIADLEFEVRGV